MKSKYSHLNLKLGRAGNEPGLDAIPRDLGRTDLGPGAFPYGYDLWNAWEAGFMYPGGIPEACVLQIVFSSNTPCLVESKSLKLFLNQLNQKVFPSRADYLNAVKKELEQCVQGPVFLSPIYDGCFLNTVSSPGVCLEEDALEIPNLIKPDSQALNWIPNKGLFSCFTRVFRSNCPVTAQPDFGTVSIELDGDLRPDNSSLLAYLLAFRLVQEFHETCCETIFTDLLTAGDLTHLKVSCHFTRRGGLDINPVRSLAPVEIVWGNRFWRQ